MASAKTPPVNACDDRLSSCSDHFEQPSKGMRKCSPGFAFHRPDHRPVSSYAERLAANACENDDGHGMIRASAFKGLR
jgi:hypothetical protein